MGMDTSEMPKLGFGLMRLPEKDGVIYFDQVCKMVDAYLATGMNYFDTAYVYHGGNSEKMEITIQYMKSLIVLIGELRKKKRV